MTTIYVLTLRYKIDHQKNIWVKHFKSEDCTSAVSELEITDWKLMWDNILCITE